MIGSRIEAVSLVDQVAGAVRRSILTGELEPGQPFKVKELAESLGVSVIPVREALQRLAAVGLLELRAGRRAVVAPLSGEDLAELYRLRGLLEGDAAERSAPLLTEDHLTRLQACLVAMAGLAPSSEEFWLTHQEFHRGLIEPALTVRLEQTLAPLYEQTERYIRLVYEDVDFAEHGAPDEVHAPILQAARARDGQGVREALLAHYRHNVQWMLGGLSELLARTSPSG